MKTLLKKTLPKNDCKTLESDLKWQFLLDKRAKPKRSYKLCKRKRGYLTRKLRKEMGLVKLPKTDWNYESLENMRQMWRQYMRSNLELAGKMPDCQDQDWSGFSLILARSELIGSEVKVVRSKVPSQVGMQGTIVLETKMTFQIITPESQLKSKSILNKYENQIKIFGEVQNFFTALCLFSNTKRDFSLPVPIRQLKIHRIW